MAVKLYLNEDIPPDLARLLRERGFDVVSTYEVGMGGQPDEAQMEYAGREGRTILSYNFHDFLRLAREWYDLDKGHFGVIVSYHQYPTREIGRLLETVVNLLTQITPEEMYNTVRSLDEFIQGGPRFRP